MTIRSLLIVTHLSCNSIFKINIVQWAEMHNTDHTISKLDRNTFWLLELSFNIVEISYSVTIRKINLILKMPATIFFKSLWKFRMEKSNPIAKSSGSIIPTMRCCLLSNLVYIVLNCFINDYHILLLRATHSCSVDKSYYCKEIPLKLCVYEIHHSSYKG